MTPLPAMVFFSTISLPTIGMTSSDDKTEYIPGVQNSWILLRTGHLPVGAQSKTPGKRKFPYI